MPDKSGVLERCQTGPTNQLYKTHLARQQKDWIGVAKWTNWLQSTLILLHMFQLKLIKKPYDSYQCQRGKNSTSARVEAGRIWHFLLWILHSGG